MGVGDGTTTFISGRRGRDSPAAFFFAGTERRSSALFEKARTHGPGSAAVAVNAAALKTRNLKVKLALKGLGKILQLLDTKTPKK